MKFGLKRSKFPFWYILGLGFINIIDGLAAILTLGFYTSQLSLPYVLSFHRWQIKKKKT